VRPTPLINETDTAIDELSQAQIDCLLLVHQGLTSKKIARRLGISPHTVDQRIRHALHVLDCERRVGAARLVASRQSEAGALS
jgi:DNA-binding CsgD family transcriptional regulator